MRLFKALLVVTAGYWLAMPACALAGNSPFFKGEVQAAPAPHGLPKSVQNVGIDQHLGDQVTMNLAVRDEHGNTTTLGSYFGKRPVILVMAYYECPNLCTLVMNGVFGAMKALPFVPGKDFDVVSVSINPHEKFELAAKKKESYLNGYHQADHADAYHFLTADQPTIDILTKEVGFRYSYDTESHQFAHASGIMVLTPDGRLSRYFYGVEYAPRDLKYGLIDASGGKIGSVADKLLLFCYHYDPSSGKYGAAITTMLRIGGGATLLAMGMMFLMFRRRAKQKLHLQTGGMSG
jgi:protein SCO1/2